MDDKQKEELIQAYSAIVSRVNLMSRLGQQYDGDRDIYQALGYPLTLTYSDYAAKYDRQDAAKAIIDRPVNGTWQGGVSVVETTDAEETSFEKDWKELDNKLKFSSKFRRLDKLTGIGHYGVMLLGLDDVGNKDDLKKPVLGKRKLLYVKPLGEGSAQVKTWENNTKDERYGLPKFYSLTIVKDSNNSTTIEVHWSRVVHVTDDLLESESEGTPRYKALFNRLMDLEKLVGGSAEMFWRGARPGYQGKVEKDYQMTDETKTDLKDQVDEFEHNLRRIMINEGVDLKALQSQVSDPKNHADIQYQAISMVTGIPKRILTGSEVGELASGQDRVNWLTYLQGRRDNFAEPEIVRPFVDRLISYGILSKPQESYNVVWSDLFAPSEKDKAEVGEIRAKALKEYTTNLTAESVVPEKAFFKYFLGLSEGDIELIEEMRLAEVEEETRID